MKKTNKCILRNIDHSNFKEKFKDTYFFCKLFERQGTGMNQLGIVCGACCIRCQMIGEVLTELIMKGAITYDALEREPNCFFEYLSEELTKYGEVVSELSGKDWETMRGICNRCNPLPVEPQVVPKARATKMSNVGVRSSYGK